MSKKWDKRTDEYLLEYYQFSSIDKMITAFRGMGYSYTRDDINARLEQLGIEKLDNELLYVGEIKPEPVKKNTFRLGKGYWVLTNNSLEDTKKKHARRVKDYVY